MTTKVETKEVTETVVTVTMGEDTAQQLEGVLRLVRYYDGNDEFIEALQGLSDIYDALTAGYNSTIEGDEIVLEKI